MVRKKIDAGRDVGVKKFIVSPEFACQFRAQSLIGNNSASLWVWCTSRSGEAIDTAERLWQLGYGAGIFFPDQRIIEVAAKKGLAYPEVMPCTIWFKDYHGASSLPLLAANPFLDTVVIQGWEPNPSHYDSRSNAVKKKIEELQRIFRPG